jgi:hypothetical protein
MHVSYYKRLWGNVILSRLVFGDTLFATENYISVTITCTLSRGPEFDSRLGDRLHGLSLWLFQVGALLP